MFDIGFSEILVIAVVALIVIGPERLPKVARTLGHLFGRLQRYVAEVKADIDREMQMEELKKLQSSMQEAVSSVEKSVSEGMRDTETQIKTAAEDVEKTVEHTASSSSASNPETPSINPHKQT
ncbi:MAG TPA: Sec-independent protein translocase protein TatB [Burkholderiales bacterium]|nr:Sec-independent protein translocase protein TatB [Burkholderiales bacterium]